MQHHALLAVATLHAGNDVTITTGLSPAQSVPRPQPVPQQLSMGQVQQDSPPEQASLYRSSGTAHLQTLAQSQPQPPVTSAWMERLLQELSLDDEVGADALPKVNTTTWHSKLMADCTEPQIDEVHVSSERLCIRQSLDFVYKSAIPHVVSPHLLLRRLLEQTLKP